MKRSCSCQLHAHLDSHWRKSFFREPKGPYAAVELPGFLRLAELFLIALLVGFLLKGRGKD
jgi:hypothetical protein